MKNEIAITILEQLGGNRFITMAGVKNIVTTPRGVYFSISSGALHRINKVKVTLNATDLYDLTFYAGSPVNMREVTTLADVYAENLQFVFTETTGFDTKL